MKLKGPTIITVVRNEATTPGATSRTPFTAASTAPSPAWRRRTMFSEMTMASSISRPTATSSATMVIMLMV